MIINNPIIRGFNPDPSIIRLGTDYYIATSTFEWFPGVQIHHSKDLKNWKLVKQILTRQSQLDLRGVPDSCGVWAPCLSYDNGLFYLVYSNVKSFDGVWKDTPNYLITATDIMGEWTDPIYLSSRGFDGSLFHQSNGKKWFTNMLVDYRKGKFFGGIELQEYDEERKKLVGAVHYLTAGTELGFTEGPHIFEKDNFFYLILAEGGTEYNHAVSIARSKALLGPYEFHPENPILTAKNNSKAYLQKTGHADFIESPSGDWYLTFLSARPLSQRGRCLLGRETSLEELIWKNGWPYVKEGKIARKQFSIPNGKEEAPPNIESKVTFEKAQLPPDFQSLRIPIDESWCSLKKRSGYLRIRGRESLNSLNEQSLIARRIQHFNIDALTELEFEPSNFLHMAGLVFYYNTGHYHYLNITADNNGLNKYISIISSDNFTMSFQEKLIQITDNKKIILKGSLRKEKLQFFVSFDNISFQSLGNELDASILSDDYVREGSNRYRPAFTGCFVGMCCQDLDSYNKNADFKWFKYIEYDT